MAKKRTPRPGRPSLSADPIKRQVVSMTPAHIATARRLGDGNISAGVRAALDSVDPAKISY